MHAVIIEQCAKHSMPRPRVSFDHDPGGYSHSGGPGGDVNCYHRVSADLRVIADNNRPDEPSPRTDVHMATNARYAGLRGSNCHLLKKEAIGPDFSAGMNDDPVRVRDEQSAANIAIDWNISPRDNRPKTMPQYRPSPTEPVSSSLRELIIANAS